MFVICLSGMAADIVTTLLDANQIYVTAENGKAGKSAELVLNMKNRNLIQRWECTLVLPEGVTFSDATLYARVPEGYTPSFTATPNNDGSVFFNCEPAEEDAVLVGNDGPIAIVTVNIDKTVAPGAYQVYVSGTKLYEPDGGSIRVDPKTRTFEWTIESVPEYTIVFDTDGGSEIPSITAEVGSTITPPEDPTKEGYTFNGWNPEIPEVMPEGGLTVVAQWVINKYTVYLETEGLTASNMNPEYGSSVTITVEELPDQVFESLLVNQEDVTAEMTDNTYVIENVTSDIYVWAMFRATNETIEIQQDYTPFSCSQDLDFTGSDLKAYIASGFNRATNQVILVRANEVPAFTGVLLIGNPGSTYKIPYNTTNCYYSSIFVPCIQGAEVTRYEDSTGNENFVFDVVEGEPGFYPVTEGTTVDLPAQSAYLQLPRGFAQAEVKVGFWFEDDVIDGINDLNSQSTMANGQAIYNLSGQRISKMQKGINIVNGKKILVK